MNQKLFFQLYWYWYHFNNLFAYILRKSLDLTFRITNINCLYRTPYISFMSAILSFIWKESFISTDVFHTEKQHDDVWRIKTFPAFPIQHLQTCFYAEISCIIFSYAWDVGFLLESEKFAKIIQFAKFCATRACLMLLHLLVHAQKISPWI